MTMDEAIVQVAWEGTGERTGKADDQQPDVAKCHIRAQAPFRLSAIDYVLDWLDCLLGRAVHLRVLDRDPVDQGEHDHADAQVEGAVHGPAERSEGARRLGQRQARFLRHARQHVERCGAQQRLTVGEPTIQHANATPRTGRSPQLVRQGRDRRRCRGLRAGSGRSFGVHPHACTMLHRPSQHIPSPDRHERRSCSLCIS
jgi:hypothetical protein